MRTLLLWLFISLPMAAASQHYHFIYIQGQNNQVFYLKKQGEVLSSSAAGFIILPKLPSGTHQFTIGFPKNQFPEYEFRVEIKSADRGFTLKSLEEKGWVLLDMQSGEILSGRKLDPPQAVIRMETSKSSDPFSVILASAVGDPGIRETSLVAMNTSRSMGVASRNGSAPRVSKTSGSTGTESVNSYNATSDQSLKETPPAAPPVTKELPPVTKETAPGIAKELPPVTKETAPPVAREVGPVTKETTPPVAKETAPREAVPVTVVRENIGQDVVAAPSPGREAGTSAQTRADSGSGVAMVKANASQAETAIVPGSSTLPRIGPYVAETRIRKISEVRGWKTTELIFVDPGEGIADTITVLIDDGPGNGTNAENVQVQRVAPANRDNCKQMADDKDMMNLRKKVLRQQNEEEMLILTLKEMKGRCYTVEMLQNMSYVFITERMRYRLFEEAYPVVYDPANYAQLERLLSTEEYISKFRALIKSN